MAYTPEQILISDDKLDEILTEIAFPILNFDILPYTKEQVKQYFLWPAMRDYFRYFPKIDVQEISVNGDFEVAFPDNYTFAVIDIRNNTNTRSGGSFPSGNPFIDSQNIISGSSVSGKGLYGTRYNFGQQSVYYSRRAEYQAMKNTQSASRFYIDKGSRKITGYANVGGRLSISWAKLSDNFDDIIFEREQDVMNLCRSNLLRAWGNMNLMQASQGDNELDGDFMISRSEELKEKVFEIWNNMSKPVIIRNR